VVEQVLPGHPSTATGANTWLPLTAVKTIGYSRATSANSE
jgi:hypothetical protein